MRTDARRPHAKLTRDQVFAAHKIYVEKKWSVRQIAELIWEQAGYKHAATCGNQLRCAFRSYGLPTRDQSERQRLRWAQKGGCASCGVSKEEKTKGCLTCRHRHRHRKHKGLSYIMFTRSGEKYYYYPDRNLGGCVECGREDDGEYTTGCVACLERKYSRERRKDPIKLERLRDNERASQRRRREAAKVQQGENSYSNGRPSAPSRSQRRQAFSRNVL